MEQEERQLVGETNLKNVCYIAEIRMINRQTDDSTGVGLREEGSRRRARTQNTIE